MDFFLDQKTKDLVLDGGDFKIIQNQVDQLTQRLFIRFKTFRRDLFWNPSYGIDYLRDVFGIAKKKHPVDVIFMNEILKEEMVLDLLSFESEINNYNYGCKFSVSLRKTEIVTTYYVLTTENGLTLTDENGNQLVAKL